MEENTTKSLKQCQSYLYKQIGRYAKSKKGYQDKLYQKEFPPAVIAEAIAIAEQKGYINDDNYAENYIYSNKEKKGVIRLRNELLNKGVQANIIEKYLDIDQTDTAIKIAQKYMLNKQVDYATMNKLYRHMASKGFTYDLITAAISNIKSDYEIIDL